MKLKSYSIIFLSIIFCYLKFKCIRWFKYYEYQGKDNRYHRPDT